VTSTDATGTGTSGPAVPAPGTGRPHRRSRRRLVGWLGLAVVLVGALLVGAVDDRGPRSPGDRVRNLAESIACPRCDGQSVADSDSDAAEGVRSLIEQRIAEGASDAQIRDELAAAYGEQVLLTPGRSGVAGLVWALPVVVLVAAVAGLGLAFRRWRGGGAARATDADRALVEAARAAGDRGARDGGSA
jgi:cytochrome c-type biogenesis protein CcmH